MRRSNLLLLLSLPAVMAQPSRKPFQAQSSSTIALATKSGESILEMSNAIYEVAGPGIPTLPPEDLLVLRKITHSKQTLGDIGLDASVTIEAWPLGTDLKEKPRYSVSVPGTECRTVDNALLVVSRGLEETDWWTVYTVAAGKRLFDTYLPLVRFSIARETLTLRYAGLQVPGDDIADPRLKDPRVVAVVIYASAERVIREALIAADNPAQAAQLRSFADETRGMSWIGSESAPALRLTFSQNYPGTPATRTVRIPIARDDLDVIHAEVPPGLHISAWKR